MTNSQISTTLSAMQSDGWWLRKQDAAESGQHVSEVLKHPLTRPMLEATTVNMFEGQEQNDWPRVLTTGVSFGLAIGLEVGQRIGSAEAMEKLFHHREQQLSWWDRIRRKIRK